MSAGVLSVKLEAERLFLKIFLLLTQDEGRREHFQVMGQVVGDVVC